MASYWRSPYKEPSHISNHGPITSTGRFEQSLSLTRAKTSVLSSGQDLLAWHLPPPRRPGSSQQCRTSTNGNLKGILKTPKTAMSPRIRVQIEDGNREESGSDQKSNLQRTSKRVSFGPCEDNFEDDSEYGSSNFRGFRAHYVTLQRLNHSRKVEESAMRKLNKLISGAPMKSPNQSTPTVKSSITKASSLPVVDGKGLLTPRSEPGKVQCSCKHSPDLKCQTCASKDVETGEIEIKSLTTEAPEPDGCSDCKPVFGVDANPDLANEPSGTGAEDSASHTVKIALFDDDNAQQSVDKTSVKRRTTPRKTKPAGFQTKKFQSKLLPGRYPFTTGAIHFRHPGLKKTNSEKTRASDKTEGVATSNGQTESHAQGNTSAKPVSKKSSPQTSPDSTGSQSTEISDGSYAPVPVIKPTRDSRERKYSDKTSQILTWLKDVRQKQNFKPRNARFLVIESQPLQ